MNPYLLYTIYLYAGASAIDDVRRTYKFFTETESEYTARKAVEAAAKAAKKASKYAKAAERAKKAEEAAEKAGAAEAAKATPPPSAQPAY